MADVIKQASFRLSEDDVVKFREIADQQDLNQAEMFQSLLNSFEMAKAKGQITNRAKEVETFQVTVNTLVSMFVSSLAINQSSEDRIREELSLELHTKDNSIADLQEEKTRCKEDLKLITEDLVAKDKSIKEIESTLLNSNKDLSQKNNIVDSLQSQLNTLNSIVDEYKGFKDTNTILESSIKDLTNINSNLISKNTDIKFKLDNETKMKEFFESKIESLNNHLDISNQDKKEIELEHKKEIESLKSDIQNNTIKYNDSLDVNNQERKTLEQDHKTQLEVLKTEFNDKLEKEAQKSKNEFNERLVFEKEKMQLVQDKLSDELKNNKLKYNDILEAGLLNE